jgi:DNA polymerase-3 subunit epsilon
VIHAVVEMLRAYLADPLVIFNARYDLTVLDRECRRHGIEPLDTSKLYVVDPLVIDKHLHRYRKGSRKLQAICEHYRAVLDDAHAAHADALAAARVAYQIGRHGKIVRKARDPVELAERNQLEWEWECVRNDIEQLHEVQTIWAETEARRLRAYFAEQGRTEDAADVREGWPVVPVAVAA